jgi:hypothetical protein
MSNPYESPESKFFDDPSGGPKGPLAIRRTSFVGQVTVVAVLMIVHGALVVLMGGTVATVWLTGADQFEKEFEKQRKTQNEAARKRLADKPGQQVPDVLGPGFVKVMTAGIAVVGVLCVAAGLLSMIAGIMNLRFKGRVLGIFSLLFGFGASLSCYCAPTAVALGIYGLVVYFNSDVARAFAAVKQGYSPAEVKAAARRDEE